MTFNEYQELTAETAIYPNKGNNLPYPALGLCGEAGEVAEKVKKIIRDDAGVVSPDKRENIKKELGDVMWYVSAVATELQLNLQDIAKANIDKLFDRRERGVLSGSGDNR
jgi:NTP pyrophosphatase (non-canonical NTP hydrolase)